MTLILLASFEFLNSPISAFSISKGNAVTGFKYESFQIFLNPAGMGKDFSVSYYRYIGSDIITFSKGLDLFNNSIGLGTVIFNGGKMIERDTMGESLGVFYDANLVPYFCINKNFNKLNIGASLFTPYEKVLNYSTYGFGVNLGMIYSLNDKIHTGLLLRNFGYIFKPLIDYRYAMPGELRIGFVYRDNIKYIGFDLMYPFAFALGFNYNLSGNITFNAGFNRNKDLNSGEGGDVLNGFIFGLGIKKGSINITYNVLFSGIFGINHTFGLKF